MPEAAKEYLRVTKSTMAPDVAVWFTDFLLYITHLERRFECGTELRVCYFWVVIIGG